MTATPDALFTNNSPAGIVVSDASSPFEFEAIGAQFECTHAIYPTGGQASICYVTSEQRARLIVAALNHFKESGKLDEWMSAENTYSRNGGDDNSTS